MPTKGTIQAPGRKLLHTPHQLDLIGAAAQEFVKECQDLLTKIPKEDAFNRVVVLSHLTVALTSSCSDQAGAVAQQTKMAATLSSHALARAYALVAQGISSPLSLCNEERVFWAREILRTAIKYEHHELAPAGYYLLLQGLLTAGEFQLLDLELTGQGEFSSALPELLQSPPAQWFSSLRLVLDGDITAAQQQLAQNISQISEPANCGAFAFYASLNSIVRWMHGELESVEDDLLSARRYYPQHVFWSAALCLIWLRQGRRTQAETLYASLPPPAELPKDQYWLSTVIALGEVATELSPASRISELREILLPLERTIVPLGVGIAFWGTVARSLGLLEEKLGLIDQAKEHLQLAVQLTAQLNAVAWLVEAQIALAEFALRHGLADVPAQQLLAEAEATASARGFWALAERANRRPKIQVLGRFEVLTAEGELTAWTSRKARDLLKLLVAYRGVATSREVFMDALWPGVPPEKLSNRLSVAVHTVRRALDPQRNYPTTHHLRFEDESLWLVLEHVDVDAEEFIRLVAKHTPQSLERAQRMYSGQAFCEEPYADWAIPLREAVDHAYGMLTKSR